jgi:hypothetical protein
MQKLYVDSSSKEHQFFFPIYFPWNYFLKVDWFLCWNCDKQKVVENPTIRKITKTSDGFHFHICVSKSFISENILTAIVYFFHNVTEICRIKGY